MKPRYDSRAGFVALVASLTVMIAAAVVLFGSRSDVTVIRAMVPAVGAAKPNAVLAFFLCAAGLVLWLRGGGQRHAEAAKREGAARLAAIVDAAMDAIISIDRNQRIVQFNAAAERMLGCAAQTVMGQSVEQFIPERSRALYREMVARLEAPGGIPRSSILAEIQCARRANGEEFPIEVSISDAEVAGEKVYTVIVRDVTERKRAQVEIEQTLSMLRATLDSTADGIVVVDRAGKFSGYNRKFAEIWQIPDAILCAGDDAQALEFVRDQLCDPDTFLHRVQALYAQPDASSFDVFEFRDGRVVERYSQPQRVGDRIVGRVWSFRDVTEHKRAEAARQEEAEVSAALARMGKELIVSLGLPTLLERLCRLTAQSLSCDFSVTLLSRPEEQIYVPLAHYGCTPEEWETTRSGRLSIDMFAATRAALQDRDMVQVRVATSSNPLGVQLANQLHIDVILYMALRREGEIVGLQVAGYRDTSATFNRVQQHIAAGIAHLASLILQHARTLKELEQANRLKSEFLATMSHELRTPLNIILGYNGLLLEDEFGALSAAQRAIISRTQTSARELFDLVSATLDLSRLEAGRVPLDLSEIATVDLVAQIDAETREMQRKSGLRFEWDVEAQLPRLRTDPGKIKVVLKNLIGNAVKFTDQGHIRVSVRHHAGGVQFEVADTGIGIPTNVLPIIFGLFRQGESSTARHYPGVGLGLYIARRLLELLGGTISVDSTVGQGSVFRVWIPLQSETVTRVAPPALAAPA